MSGGGSVCSAPTPGGRAWGLDSCAGVAQWQRRSFQEGEVEGSNPSSGTMKEPDYDRIMEEVLVEGARILLVEAEFVHRVWDTPMKELPFDMYFVGRCKCQICMYEQNYAWPAVDNTIEAVECDNCSSEMAFPSAWED